MDERHLDAVIVEEKLGWLLLIPFFVCLVLCPGCGPSAGGSGESVFSVVTVRSGSGAALPWEFFYLNEGIILDFTAPVDPLSVSADSIQVRTEASGFSEKVDGGFSVEGSRVRFVPRFPVKSDLSDGALVQDTGYRVFLPGSSSAVSLRSITGRPLVDEYSGDFRTRSREPLTLDPDPGPPFLLTTAVDLDRNGVLEADGDPLTVNPEEAAPVDGNPSFLNIPVGRAIAPTSLVFSFSEPIFPSSVFEDVEGDGPDHVLLRNVTRAVNLPFRLELDQSFRGDLDRFQSFLIVTPRTTLPPASILELRFLNGIRDYADPPLVLVPTTVIFSTEGESQEVFFDGLVEDFQSTENRDPGSTADWNENGSASLAPGSSIGGSGEMGDLVVLTGSGPPLSAEETSGFFDFRSIYVGPQGILRFTGNRPIILRCVGDILIEGEIRLDGERGSDGPARVGSLAVQGGQPGPGGFPGGDANSPSDPGQGSAGEGPPGFPQGGGGGGVRLTTSSGSGGGGGHRTQGERDSFGFSGDAGEAYPSEFDDLPFGGGGGGGGGNLRSTFGGDNAGGAGGGGGGVLLLSCAGNLVIRGGVITSDGGEGGTGGPPIGASSGAGGGGGGAGGTVELSANRILIETGIESALLTARSGPGGEGGSIRARDGGAGGLGEVSLIVFDENGNGMADEVTMTSDTRFDPSPSVELLNTLRPRRSFAQSRFLDTGTDNPIYSFDGSDPDTGYLLEGAMIEDVVLRSPIPPGVKVKILFEGVPEDPDFLGKPDENAATGFTSRIDSLSGLRFIRYRVEFDLGDGQETVVGPELTRITIPFRFEIE